MPFDPSLPLQIAQASQPQDSLAQYGKVIALKNALQQGQIGQQQLQEGSINLQQKQLLFNDQQKISQVLADPTVGGDIEKAIPKLGAAGVSGQSIIALTKAHADNKKTLADTALATANAGKAQQELEESQANTISDLLQSSNDSAATSGGPAQSLLGHLNALKAASPSLSPKLDALASQVLNAPDHNAAAQQVITNGITQATKNKTATAAEQTAGAAQKNAQADELTFKNALMKAAVTGQGGEQLIQQRFAGNPDAAAQALAAWRQNLSSGDLAKANEEVNKVYDNTIGAPGKAAATVKAETPAKVAQGQAMIPVEAATAAAKATAEIPARVAGAVAERKAVAATSPSAFEGIVDPTVRNQAMTEADKIYKDYTDKIGNTQAFLDSVNAARTNPAIAATLPMQEVRQFINRVNTSEIRSVSSGVGGILDRADTWLQKNTTGTPPKWLLDDITQIAPIQIRQAQQGFNAGKQRLQMRGVDVSKLPPPDTGETAASGHQVNPFR